MKIMVTGGAGYIGSELVPALLGNGYEVRVIDNLTFGKSGLSNCLDQIELVPIDIRNVEKEHFDGIDAVIHLAGISNDPTADFDPYLNKIINFNASVNLARLAKESLIEKFIFASSCSVYYTDKPDIDLKNEDSSIAPKAAYSWSKYEAEKGILALSDKTFYPVVLRQGTLFGCSNRMRFDLVVNTFTLHAFLHHKLNLNGGGKMWRPLLYLKDAVDVYLNVLTADKETIGGKIFNVLNRNYQVIEIAKEVRAVLKNKADIELEFLDSKDVRSYFVNGNKLKKTLNLCMETTLRPAIEEMWELIQTGKDFTDPVYYNISWLEKTTNKNKFNNVEICNYRC